MRWRTFDSVLPSLQAREVERTFEDALSQFPGREEGLRAVERWHIYRPMFYRTNLWIHSRRVRRTVARVGPLIAAKTGLPFDQQYAEAMALVHDDLELIIGDVQAGNKTKMNAAQRAELKRREEAAIEELATRYPSRVGRYSYRDLLLAVHHDRGPESWAVQIADKLDAFEEAMHEIFAGNTRFTTPVTTEFGQLALPYDHYVTYFSGFAARYPEVAFLVQGPDKFLEIDDTRDCNMIAARGAPHTLASLDQPTGFQPYDLWKGIQLAGAREEEEALLTTRLE